MNTKNESLKVIDSLSKSITDISDNIWDHPETGYQEFFAANLYCEFLKANGFELEEGICGIPTAFCATYGSGRPVIGFLAEYDALEGMSQQAEVTECIPVTPGAPGHGCGHNLLGAGILGAVLAVKDYLSQGKPGTVKLFGCPGEEIGSGKTFMSRAGAFDDLDTAISWHPSDVTEVGLTNSLANQQICYHFKGIASHAASSPEMGRSALDACELMNVGVQFLREHVPTSCRIHYAITNSGGNTPGIVQPTADVLYLMRAPEFRIVKDLRERIDNIAKGAALMTGTTVDIEFKKACSDTVPNLTLAKTMQKSLDELGNPVFDDNDRALADALFHKKEKKSDFYMGKCLQVTDPVKKEALLKYADAPIYEEFLPLSPFIGLGIASTDVGDVSNICPVVQVYVATMPANTSIHSWQEVSVGKSAMAHKGMLQAAKIMASCAMDLYDDPEIIAEAKNELKERLKGEAYICPIPKEIPCPAEKFKK